MAVIAGLNPDLPITAATGTNPPQIHYIHTDHLNTPRLITDTARNLRWRWSPITAEPFGATPPVEQPTATQPKLAINLRFPGQMFDAETGHFYNFHRTYNPQTGRYVQSDPIGLQGGLNTYAYVEGDPVNGWDAEGLQNLRTYNGGSSNQRRWARRHPQMPTYIPQRPNVDNLNEAAGYFGDDGSFVCLRWYCPDDPNACKPRDYQRHTDFMPAATNAAQPPEGCVCDQLGYNPYKGPKPPRLSDPGLWKNGTDFYQRYSGRR